MKQELLEELAALNECYISDLRTRMNDVEFVNSIEKIKPEDYDYLEWYEVIKYLCDGTPETKDVNEIQKKLVQCLRSKMKL
ncbi:MAG: hypothetical protein RR670_01215 [Erysipelotrichaceae bacterium]